MTTWDRALYARQLLPPRQQHQLESLVSEATGKPIRRTTLADPSGYGIGVTQQTTRQTGTTWDYEGETFGYRVVHYPARPRNPAGIRGPVHPGPDSSWPGSMTTTGKGRRNGNGLA